MVTLWCFIGIEGAVVISGKAQKKSDVSKATIIGFSAALLMYLLLSALAFGILKQEELSQLDDWNSSNIDESINIFVNAINVGKGKLMQPLRIALTGALKGPSIPDLMTLLGKETCLTRFKNILKNS